MYRPDRAIVRKIREFDPHLFVEWNQRRNYFEIWRRGVWGRRLVVAVTRALYEPGAPKEFTPLDERILACLYEPWGSGDHMAWYDKQDQKELDDYRRKRAQFRANTRAVAMDAYRACTNFFATKHASKNSGRPNLNRVSANPNWVRPDVQLRTSSRLFQRSALNARLYGYRRK
jgi:hypothetical protein